MDAFSSTSTGLLYLLDLASYKTEVHDVAKSLKIKPCDIHCVRVNNMKNEILILAHKIIYKLDFDLKIKQKINLSKWLDDEKHFFVIDEHNDQYIFLYCQGKFIIL